MTKVDQSSGYAYIATVIIAGQTVGGYGYACLRPLFFFTTLM